MTQINDTSRFEAEHAKRQFEALHHQTRVSLLRCIDSAIEALDEARRALLEERTPNTCGILQTKATDVEMGIGRLAAMDEAAKCFRALARASGVAER